MIIMGLQSLYNVVRESIQPLYDIACESMLPMVIVDRGLQPKARDIGEVRTQMGSDMFHSVKHSCNYVSKIKGSMCPNGNPYISFR